MSAISSMVSSVSKGLLDQRKPHVLQEYAEKMADALSKTGLAGLFKLDEIHQYQGHGANPRPRRNWAICSKSISTGPGSGFAASKPTPKPALRSRTCPTRSSGCCWPWPFCLRRPAA